MSHTFTRTWLLSLFLLLASLPYGSGNHALAAHVTPLHPTSTVIDGTSASQNTHAGASLSHARAAGSSMPDILQHPGVIYLLLMIGLWGLLFEAFLPGLIVPGAIGALSLLTALYALQSMSVNVSSLAWIWLGIILLTSELFLPSFGILGLLGAASFVMGLAMLLIANILGFEVNAGLIIGMVLAGIVILVITVWLLVRAHRAHVVSGDQQMLDATGTLLEDIEAGGTGWALIYGERWYVNSAQHLSRGTKIKVIRRDGLTLWIDAIHSSS